MHLPLRCPFSCSASRFLAQISQNGLLGSKMLFAGPGSQPYLPPPLQRVQHKKFAFLAYFGPENQILSTLHLFSPLSDLRRSRLKMITPSPCPEVTLWPTMLCFGLICIYAILQYCLVLHCILLHHMVYFVTLWYCKVWHGMQCIVWYLMLSYGI